MKHISRMLFSGILAASVFVSLPLAAQDADPEAAEPMPEPVQQPMPGHMMGNPYGMPMRGRGPYSPMAMRGCGHRGQHGMKHNRQQGMQNHRKAMEERLQRIEALLQQLVDKQ